MSIIPELRGLSQHPRSRGRRCLLEVLDSTMSEVASAPGLDRADTLHRLVDGVRIAVIGVCERAPRRRGAGNGIAELAAISLA